jgi:hypothetical protein
VSGTIIFHKPGADVVEVAETLPGRPMVGLPFTAVHVELSGDVSKTIVATKVAVAAGALLIVKM